MVACAATRIPFVWLFIRFLGSLESFFTNPASYKDVAGSEDKSRVLVGFLEGVHEEEITLEHD